MGRFWLLCLCATLAYCAPVDLPVPTEPSSLSTINNKDSPASTVIPTVPTVSINLNHEAIPTTSLTETNEFDDPKNQVYINQMVNFVFALEKNQPAEADAFVKLWSPSRARKFLEEQKRKGNGKRSFTKKAMASILTVCGESCRDSNSLEFLAYGMNHGLRISQRTIILACCPPREPSE